MLWLASSLIIGWERKVRRCGHILASLWAGVEVIIFFRRFAKASLGPLRAYGGVGMFDIVVVWNQDALGTSLSTWLYSKRGWHPI